MALLDDLKGILSPAEFAKLQSNAAITARVAKSDELYDFYMGEETPPTPEPVKTAPVVSATPPPATGAFDLSAIESMFDRKLAGIDKTISSTVDSKLGEVVKTQGENLRKSILQQTVEITEMRERHMAETGKPLDKFDFNTFLEKPENKGRFRTIPEAYESYVAPQSQEREVERRVTERLKTASGSAGVPGSTPAPSSNKPLLNLLKRGGSAAGVGSTAVEKSAAMLDRLSSQRQEQAS